MDDMSPIEWPNGARCAVMLTFDFDAETLWLSRNPDNARRPGVLSQGIYGAKTGVPKILELMREESLKGTFFVPGWTAEKYRDRMDAIAAAGHEIGHHGYLHEWIDPDFPDKEREALEKGLEALRTTVGVKPKGYRSPAGETSQNMIGLLHEYGFEYDSSLMDQVSPYRHVLEDGTPGPVELPWHWSMDDAPFALFAIQSPRPIPHQRPHPERVETGIHGNLPLGRAGQRRHASADHRQAVAARHAARVHRLRAPLS